MDKFYKKISLEQAKNRTFNNLDYYDANDKTLPLPIHDDGKTWGGYCVDVLIPRLAPEQDACIPVLAWVENLVDTLCLEYVIVDPSSEQASFTWEGTEDCEACDPTDVKGAYWARYKNLMRLYFWLLNTFIPSIQFYRKCLEGFQLVEVTNTSDVFDSDMQIIGDLSEAATEGIEHYKYEAPDTLKIIHAGIVNETILKLFYKTSKVIGNTLYLTNGLQIGELVGVSELYDEFINKFKDLTTAKGFLGFMDRLLDEGIFQPLSGTTPYMDVEFSINNTQIDMGLMSPILEKWAPKKKYYLGERVMYNNETYRLTSCKSGNYDLYEITGPLLESVLSDTTHNIISNSVPSAAYNISNYVIDTGDDGVLEYKRYILRKVIDGSTRYYFIQPYDTGIFHSKTRTTTFDIARWTLVTGVKKIMQDGSLYEDEIGDNYAFTGVTESQIVTLRRAISSVDDFGEGLPFVLKYNRYEKQPGDPDSYQDGGIVNISTDGELYYMYGILNENKASDGTWTGDAMESISYSVDNVNWIDIEGDENDGTISYTDFGDSGVTNGYIKFVYYIGCDISVSSSSKSRIPNTGVRFEEIWRFSKQQKSARITYQDYTGQLQDNWQTYDYINIYPIDNEGSSSSNLDINGKQPIYSIVTYYGKQVRGVDYMYAPFYKDEDLLHVHDVNTLEYDVQEKRWVNTVNGYIQRGTAASFERHNILGEIKTFSDLENYRNNFFGI